MQVFQLFVFDSLQDKQSQASLRRERREVRPNPNAKRPNSGMWTLLALPCEGEF